MLDTVTLRVSFGIVALTLLLLFYFVAFRSTRSAYCGWWCVALSLFLVGSGAYLLDGTDHQVWANPLGNALMVSGTASVWAGARAVKRRPVSVVVFGAAVAATAVASALDSPATNVWSGAPVYLGAMATMVAWASLELWTAIPGGSGHRVRERNYAPILRSMAVMAGLLATFYAGRTVAFLLVGPDGRLFELYFGSQVTTLINTVMLATVSFTMTALSHVDDTLDLRARATHDGLTGLLNRTEFLRLVTAKRRSGRRGGMYGSLVLADLDHFKAVNDQYGHAAGDYALQTFAAACRGVVPSTDLVGRYGGEEFIFFFEDTPPDEARQIAADISERLRSSLVPKDMSLPTVSYGIALAEPGDTFDQVMTRADIALYEAKKLGRDRIVVSGESAQGLAAS